jgi:hypothetical protein
MDLPRINKGQDGEAIRLHQFERDYDSYRGEAFDGNQDDSRQPYASSQPIYQTGQLPPNDIKRSYSPIITSLSLQEHPTWHRRPQGLLNIVFGGWWQEILAMFLAMAMFAALIATLRLYDGHALQEWPFAISINALISVQGVIMKTAMILVIAQGMFSLYSTTLLLLKR